MRFNSNINKEEYVEFYSKNDRTFMQSYEWGYLIRNVEIKYLIM